MATPPLKVITPVMAPRSHGLPRPLILPSSESASANAMLIPAPTDVAIPTRKAVCVERVANAAAKIGAREGTEPSIKPARPGWTICSTTVR